MRQSIHLLQLSSADLDQEICDALEANPLLEPGDDDLDWNTTRHYAEPTFAEVEETAFRTTGSGQQTDRAPERLDPDVEIAQIEDDPADRRLSPTQFEPYDTLNTIQHGATLREVLVKELAGHRLSNLDSAIAQAIIGCIDERGYLRASNEELREILAPGFCAELDEIEAMVRLIQSLSLRGIAARDLGECLRIQLEALDPETPGQAVAILVVDRYLDLLAQHKFDKLIQTLGVSRKELSQARDLVQNLDHAPGRHLTVDRPGHVIPDVIVCRLANGWSVRPAVEPRQHLRLNHDYHDYFTTGDPDTRRYLKEKLQEARGFIRSLSQRRDTILRVAEQIVLRQPAFMRAGASELKPLTQREIALTLELHESTVSRASDQKFMLTPQGLFEFKYFFTGSVGSSPDKSLSAHAIQAQIRKMIESEPPLKPISDSAITQLLTAQGVDVARRTVAKYRKQMNIAPANQRKSVL